MAIRGHLVLWFPLLASIFVTGSALVDRSVLPWLAGVQIVLLLALVGGGVSGFLSVGLMRVLFYAACATMGLTLVSDVSMAAVATLFVAVAIFYGCRSSWSTWSRPRFGWVVAALIFCSLAAIGVSVYAEGGQELYRSPAVYVLLGGLVAMLFEESRRSGPLPHGVSRVDVQRGIILTAMSQVLTIASWCAVIGIFAMDASEPTPTFSSPRVAIELSPEERAVRDAEDEEVIQRIETHLREQRERPLDARSAGRD